MKKLLSSLAVATALTTTAQAGSVLDFEIGGGLWTNAPSGTMTLEAPISATYDLVGGLALENAGSGYMWMVVDHLIPVVPNFRYETTTNMLFENTAATNNLNLSHSDYIAYWGVPLTTWLPFIEEFDFGIGFKAIDGSITTAAGTVQLPIPLPYAYLKLRVEPPMLFGLGFEFESKIISYADNKFSETIFKGDWGIEAPIPVIDLKVGVELGYRNMSLAAAPSAATNIDISFSGIFFGAYGKFGI